MMNLVKSTLNKFLGSKMLLEGHLVTKNKNL